MAAPTFSDEDQRTQGDHDSLGVHPERAEAEKASLEHMYNAPSAKTHYDDENEGLTSGNLADREDAGYGDGADETSSQKKEKKALGSALFGAGDAIRDKVDDATNNMSDGKKAALFGGLGALKEKFAEKTSNLSKRKKTLLFGAGLSGSVLIILIPILIIIFASLKIPNLAAHISGWQFARTSRILRQSLSQINAEKIAVDSADDVEYGVIKQKYLDVRSATWGKLDKWRPERTYRNMQATGVIDFQYSESGRLGRTRLEGIRINGADIPIDNPSFLKRVGNRVNPLTPKSDIILAAQVSASLEKAMQGHNSLIRGRVNKKILADLGIELHWWDKQGRAYRNTKAETADLIEFRESVERIGTEPADKSVSKPIQNATDAAKEERETCFGNDDCIRENYLDPDAPPGEITEGIAPERVASEFPSEILDEATEAAINNSLQGSALTKIAENASTVAAVITPLCIIYDGSVERSDGSVDAASESAQKTYYKIASAADQQETGSAATTPEAIGATNRALGDITGSVPERRARNKGDAVSTKDTIISPQASAGGMFSLLGALFGPEVGSQLDQGFEPVCSTLSNEWVQLGLGVAEITLAFYTLGSSKAGAVAGQTGVRLTTTQILGKMGRELLSKKTLKRILFESAAEAGGTLIAKMIVLSRMNAQNSGTARGQDEANIADAGGNLNSNENNRKMFYGRPLTQQEIAYSNEADRQYLAQKKGEQGVFERYLAMSNPDSLLVNMGVSLSSKLTQKGSMASMFSKAIPQANTSVFSGSLFSSLNPFKKQVAFALESTEDTNYNLVQWGWSEDELALIENDPRYFPLENDAILEQSGRKGEIQEKYGKCFEETIGTILKDQKIQRDEEGRVFHDAGDCAPNKLGRNNPDGFGDLVFRWRLSNRNNNVLDLLTDIQAPTNSESPTASPAPSGGGLGISSDGFVFPLQTTKGALTNRDPGKRWCYEAQTNCHHDYNAADIMADTGTPVVAARGGKVIFGQDNPTGGTGSSIAIMGDDKNVYWYGHLKSGSVLLRGGETVKAGDKIGEVGTDADAQNTPSHLHIDVQPPPATTRNGCTNQDCNKPPFKFLDVQPALIKAFANLPG